MKGGSKAGIRRRAWQARAGMCGVIQEVRRRKEGRQAVCAKG